MRAKHFLDLYEAQQQLLEVEMSPTNLKKLANQIDAKVGMEFEMIVPDVNTEDDEPDYQDPERYDENEPARSIDDIVDFFDERDHNTRSTIAELRRVLEEKFDEYLETYVKKDWEKRGKEYLLNWIKKNADPSDIADYLDKPEDLLGDRIPTKEDYEEVADEEWKRPGNAAGYNYYDQAYESFKDGDMIPNYYSYDEDDEADPDENSPYIYGFDRDEVDQEEFLESIGINDMDDVYNHRMNRNNDLAWTRWSDPEPVYNNNGGESIEEVASRFEDAIGRSVNWSSSYHGARRTSDGYTIEPDSSLRAYGSDEAGLEFISPPLPVDEMFDDISKIKEWADDVGAYTNSSCGLHMNVSVPNYSKSNLDYVKLAILSGDQYVLNQFGRIANSYCESALDIIKNKAKDNPQETERLFEKLRSNMEEIASKIIHNGSTRKFTSINTKENWVEFRGPGNDWLNSNFSKIENTVLRFVVALDAACDPQKYRKEYLKGLYKLLKPKDPKAEMSLFARYMAGELNKEELAGALAKKKYNRKTNDELAKILSGENDPQGILDEPAEGETTYRFMTRDGSVAPAYASGPNSEVAYNRLAARNHVWRTMPLQNISVDVAEPGRRQTPPTPSDDVNAYAPQQDGPRAQAIDQLTREYELWCDQQGLPHVDPHDQDYENLTDAQINWIMRFNARWEEAENGNTSSSENTETAPALWRVHRGDASGISNVTASSAEEAINIARRENPTWNSRHIRAERIG